ncbi:MAG: DUF1844 domain-containing protein [Akkermansiaceae bacterium]|nr:DUF1844 domain-containing protein [Akkermansiaceae bacterium]
MRIQIDSGSLRFMSDSPSEAETPDERFAAFVYFQAQNGGLFLGRIPNPATGETSVNIRAAKSVVDSLEMLTEKTKGNLNKAEDNMLKIATENLRKLLDEVSTEPLNAKDS